MVILNVVAAKPSLLVEVVPAMRLQVASIMKSLLCTAQQSTQVTHTHSPPHPTPPLIELSTVRGS